MYIFANGESDYIETNNSVTVNGTKIYYCSLAKVLACIPYSDETEAARNALVISNLEDLGRERRYADSLDMALFGEVGMRACGGKTLEAQLSTVKANLNGVYSVFRETAENPMERMADFIGVGYGLAGDAYMACLHAEADEFEDETPFFPPHSVWLAELAKKVDIWQEAVNTALLSEDEPA